MNNVDELNLSVVKGALRTVFGRPDFAHVLDSCGINPDHWELLKGDEVWTGADRLVVTKTVHALAHGIADACGLPRIALPVEFFVAVCNFSVKPQNYYAISSWVGSAPLADDLIHGAEPVNGFEDVEPRRFYSMLLLAAGQEDLLQLQTQFSKKLKEQFALVTPK